jgi:hypothetical protein
MLLLLTVVMVLLMVLWQSVGCRVVSCCVARVSAVA